MGAHPQDTWCKQILSAQEASSGETGWSKGRYVNWLEDSNMLPSLLPDARIMRYGYESAGWGPNGLIAKPADISQRLLHALAGERRVRRERRTI